MAKKTKYPLVLTSEAKKAVEAGKGKLQEMSPKAFLDAARPLHIGSGDRKLINNFKNIIKDRGALGPLKLYKDGKEDGRHRATASKELNVSKVPVIDYRASGGRLLEDKFPTHYLPHVGRQVMANGGAPSIDQIRQMLVGTAPAPSAPSPGAYTDPYGLKVAAPFVESMRGGYPTPPSAPTSATPSTPSRSSLSDLLNSIFGHRSGYDQGGEAKGEVSFLEDEQTPLPTFAQPQAQEVTQALDAAREVSQPKKEYEPFGVLPLRETEAGIEFDPYAGVLGSVTRPAKHFYETMSGQKEMEPTSEEAIRAATDIAGGLTMGAGAFERPAGAIAAGASRYYHGTPARFETFELEKSPSGFHLTESPEVAREYAGKTSPNVYTVESTHSPEKMIRADELIENQPVFGQLSDSPVDMTRPMTGERYYQALTQTLGGPLAATEYLKRVGVHGMEYPGSGKGRGHVSIFDPSLIRKVPERITNPLGMHSEAAEVVRNLPQQKGTIEQMLAMIRQKVNPEEVHWSGVQQAFRPGQKVTAEDLASHFESKLPQVQETVYGGAQFEPKYGNLDWNPQQWQNAIRRAEMNRDFDLSEALMTEWETAAGMGQSVKAPRYPEYKTPGGTNYREIVLRHPDEKETPAFTESHYDEPNVIGHLRMSDMTGPEGEKILNVHEFQSDWGQKARSQGVKTPELENQLSSVKDELNKANQEYLSKLSEFQLLINSGEVNHANNYSHPKYLEVEEARRKMNLLDVERKLLARQSFGVPAAPYVTSREGQHHTPGWTDLLIKRVMQEAEKGGYDKVVWDTPAEQAQRYTNLPKIVKGMEGYYGDVLPRRFKKVVPEAKLGEHQVGKARDAYDKDSVAEFVTAAATMKEHKKFRDLVQEGMSRDQALRAIGRHDEYLLNEADKHGLGDFLEGLSIAKLGKNQYVLYDVNTAKGLFNSEREAKSAMNVLGAEKAKKTLESSAAKRPGFEMTPELKERVRKGFSAYRYGGEIEDALDVARALR